MRIAAEDRSPPTTTRNESLGFSLSRLFLVAAAIRFSVFAAQRLLISGAGFEHPDSLYYHDRALGILRGSIDIGWDSLFLFKDGFPWFVSLVYQLVGVHPAAVETINILLGSLVVIVGYRFASEMFGPRSGKVAAVLLAVDPSLAYWSTQLLKDTIIVLATLLVSKAALVEKGSRSWRIATTFAGLAILMTLRPEYVFLLSLGLLVSATFWKPRIVVRVASGALIVGLFVAASGQGWWQGYGGGNPTGTYESADGGILSFINNVRRDSYAESHVDFFAGGMPQASFDSSAALGRALVTSPIYFVFLPFIWQARSLYELAFTVPALWWYCIGLLAVRALIRGRRDKNVKAIALQVAILGLPLILLVTSTGALIRWRLPSTALAVILAARSISPRRIVISKRDLA